MDPRLVLGIAALASGAQACVLTVDLRDPTRGDPEPPGDGACGPGQRLDPETGACASCVYEDPNLACPCGFVAQPGPFPLCDLPDADFVCTAPCSPGIEVCTGYQVVDGQAAVDDCWRLVRCCQSLAQAPGATPCCPPDSSVLCIGTGAPGRLYDVRCVDDGCCGDCDNLVAYCYDDCRCRNYEP